jgi:hypothetical protein
MLQIKHCSGDHLHEYWQSPSEANDSPPLTFQLKPQISANNITQQYRSNNAPFIDLVTLVRRAQQDAAPAATTDTS